MNKIIALGRIYKNGSIGTSRSGKTYINFAILDTKKEKEDTIRFRCVAFDNVAQRIDDWCENGDQVLAIGALENDKTTKSFTFVVSEFQRTGQKQDKNDTDQEVEEKLPF